MNDHAASRASLLTPIGRSAVAVVTASGPDAMAAVDARFRAASGRALHAWPIDRIAFGHWRDGNHREEIIVCRTGDESVEVHCHGGVAAAARILDALAAAGCRMEPWSEWVRATSLDPIVAEADVALASAATRRTAAILLDQRHGALRREVEFVRRHLTEHDAASRASAARRLAELRDRAALGLRLTRPWVVAVAGRPNVGKSSLVNALAGYQRAIVFDRPGTTRDVLAVETALDGWPVRLADTAGLADSEDPLESAGMELAREELGRADLALWVLDATRLPATESFDAAALAAQEAASASARSAPLLVAIHKTDIIIPQCRIGGVCTSAVTGAGLGELAAAIAARLVPQPPAAGAAVPFTARQAAALRAAHEHLATGATALAVAALDELLGSAGAAGAPAG